MTVKTEVSTNVMRSSVLSMLGQSRARTPDVGTLRIDALVLLPEADAPEDVGVAVVVKVLITVLVNVVPLLLLFALNGY